MADTNNYISKQKVEKWTTKEKFNALDLHTIETGTEYNLTGAIDETDLGSDLLAKINGKLTKPTNPSAESAVTMLADGTVGTKLLSEIGGGDSPTTQTKYQHNLVLEGTQLGSTFKAFMSIPRSDNTLFGTLDEIVAALGDAYISCTGYIYDGNQKSYNVIAFNTAGPGFEYNDPEAGGRVFSIGSDVNVTDNPIEF